MNKVITLARDMMLTSDEYIAFMRLITSERESEGSSEALRDPEPPSKKRSASAKRSDRILSRAFREANSKMRLKNGQLRKGRTQSDVARLAQRLRKKMK